MRWVVDQLDIVHVKHCEAVVPGPAVLYVTVPTTIEEMAEHLSRPDSQRMEVTHGGPTRLKACPTCILEDL